MMISLLIISFLILLGIPKCQSESQWMYQTEKKWDEEWKSGQWSYMETQPVERSRVAVIGSVFCQLYAPQNSSILDIGCGEGLIADFLSDSQKFHYVGLDISKEAIQLAKLKHSYPMRFVHTAAHEFIPLHNYDVIIFSDVLYYVEYEKIIDKYISHLNPLGIFIISIFHPPQKLLYENIFKYARSKMEMIDDIDIYGKTRKTSSSKLEDTAFHIEVYKKK